MATDKLDLESAVSKLIESQGRYLLRTALSGFLAEMMRREVEQLCGASYHERTEERLTKRHPFIIGPLVALIALVGLFRVFI